MGNNRGQSLVIFVLFLPIVVILLSALFDLGNDLINNAKIEYEIKDTIKYGLNHIEEENVKDKLETLLEKNIDEKGNVDIDNEVIKISIKDKVYTGYKENNKIVIKEG